MYSLESLVVRTVRETMAAGYLLLSNQKELLIAEHTMINLLSYWYYSCFSWYRAAQFNIFGFYFQRWPAQKKSFGIIPFAYFIADGAV